MATKTATVTTEEATADLVEQHRVEMQLEVDATAEAEQKEHDRLEALNKFKERAAAILEERSELLPLFIESLEQVGQSATTLRELRDEYMHLTAKARRIGGSTESVWPKAFGRDPVERNLLRKAIKILSSVGGYV